MIGLCMSRNPHVYNGRLSSFSRPIIKSNTLCRPNFSQIIRSGWKHLNRHACFYLSFVVQNQWTRAEQGIIFRWKFPFSPPPRMGRVELLRIHFGSLWRALLDKEIERGKAIKKYPEDTYRRAIEVDWLYTDRTTDVVCSLGLIEQRHKFHLIFHLTDTSNWILLFTHANYNTYTSHA